jgi:hypothetical protein
MAPGLPCTNQHQVPVLELFKPDYGGPIDRSETRAERRGAKTRYVVIVGGALEALVFITSGQVPAQLEYSLGLSRHIS